MTSMRLLTGVAFMTFAALCGSLSAEPAAPARPAEALAVVAGPHPGGDAAPVGATEKAEKAVAGAATGKAAPGAKDVVPAKKLFGAVKAPAALAARAIGYYSRGCLAGAKPLPIDGPAWQAMRLSRNRNWGHPDLIKLVEHFADDAQKKDGWPGLLVGDIAQPRGGPMLTGHASHQIGLDADIWLTPMPNRRLSEKEREELSATSMLAGDDISVDPKVWTSGHVALIKRAAGYHEVERILVHPAIKKALCEAAGKDRAWLGKVRPYWGHYYHMHIRIACPKGSANCREQAPVTGEDGCGKELTDWIARVRPKPPEPPTPGAKPKPQPPKPPLTLEGLPAECREVVTAGHSGIPAPLLSRALDHGKGKGAAAVHKEAARK
jgi:penicillin-insensitive murein endopeptidase